MAKIGSWNFKLLLNIERCDSFWDELEREELGSIISSMKKQLNLGLRSVFSFHHGVSTC